MLLTHELFPILNWDLLVNYNKTELISAMTLPLLEQKGIRIGLGYKFLLMQPIMG
jgi:hypothetical protein